MSTDNTYILPVRGELGNVVYDCTVMEWVTIKKFLKDIEVKGWQLKRSEAWHEHGWKPGTP